MTSGVVAWCLDLHGLWLSKAVAGRPKDYEFCRALANNGFVNEGTLAARLDRIPDLAEERFVPRSQPKPPIAGVGSRGHCNTSASFSDGVI